MEFEIGATSLLARVDTRFKTTMRSSDLLSEEPFFFTHMLCFRAFLDKKALPRLLVPIEAMVLADDRVLHH